MATADATLGGVQQQAGPGEQVVMRKWDRCVSNLLVNTAVGSAVGIVASFLFFKKRGSPIWLFTGFGIGHAVAQCQFDFAHPHLFHGRRVKLAADGDSASAATAPDA